jgi:carboxyl-terminal processing protease
MLTKVVPPFRYAVLLCSIVLSVCAAAFTLPGKEKPLFDFDEEHRDITHSVMELLANEHYRKRKIDDDFSSELLDSFLDSLVPNRIFFTQPEIARLEKYRYQLDNHLLDGDLESFAQIYEIYHRNSLALVSESYNDLENIINKMDFTLEQYIEGDRSESPWPMNHEESSKLWFERIKSQALLLKLTDKKSTEDIIHTMSSRLKYRLDKLNEHSVDDAFEIFINQFASLYGPHTNWLSPAALESFKINMSLSLEGIGAVLQRDDEYTKIVRLVTAGPAASTGQLQAGDRIIGVAQDMDKPFVDIVGWPLNEVVQIIRGPKGSTVRLRIENSTGIKTVKIVREKVKLEDQAAKKTTMQLQTAPLPAGTQRTIGVINVPNFYLDFESYRRGDPDFKSTTRDVGKLLEELMSQGVDGIIIDLRNNGGGSLREATTLTDLFIDKGPIVQIRDSQNNISRRYRSQRDAYYKGPLMVLTNSLSASASEIFAGAIQDYQRGIVVGNQTFGKGTVQTLSEIEQGQLKYTTAKFYRVNPESWCHPRHQLSYPAGSGRNRREIPGSCPALGLHTPYQPRKIF